MVGTLQVQKVIAEQKSRTKIGGIKSYGDWTTFFPPSPLYTYTSLCRRVLTTFLPFIFIAPISAVPVFILPIIIITPAGFHHFYSDHFCSTYFNSTFYFAGFYSASFYSAHFYSANFIPHFYSAIAFLHFESSYHFLFCYNFFVLTPVGSHQFYSDHFCSAFLFCHDLFALEVSPPLFVLPIFILFFVLLWVLHLRCPHHFLFHLF